MEVNSPDANFLFELGSQRYAVLEPLGEGGAATVHRCWDRELGVERAIKLRRVVDSHRQAEGMQRLQDEARVMARLTHDHVLPVFDVGLEDGWQWVVMELARGGSLKDLTRTGPLSPKHAINVVISLLEAVQTAHDAGVIHRDIKPHNVLIDDVGKPMLADWGIARLDERALTLTSTGVAMGSMSYMAPEQRLDAHNVDATADVYGMGALLYHIVTCASPVDLFFAQPTSPRWDDVPEALRGPLAKACSKKPADRYQSALEFAAALGALEADASDVPLSLAGTSDHGDTMNTGGQDRTIDADFPAPAASPRWPFWVAGAVGILATLAVAVLLVPGVMPQARTIILPAQQPPAAADPTEVRAPEPQAATPAPAQVKPATPAVVAAAPAKPPATDSEPEPFVGEPLPVHGDWTGSIEGQQARLRLGGRAAALRGTLTIAGARGSVSGRYTKANQTLVLDVTGQPSSEGRWTLSLGGERLRGSVQLTQTGDLLSVSFVRVPIR